MTLTELKIWLSHFMPDASARPSAAEWGKIQRHLSEARTSDNHTQEREFLDRYWAPHAKSIDIEAPRLSEDEKPRMVTVMDRRSLTDDSTHTGAWSPRRAFAALGDADRASLN